MTEKLFRHQMCMKNWNNVKIIDRSGECLWVDRNNKTWSDIKRNDPCKIKNFDRNVQMLIFYIYFILCCFKFMLSIVFFNQINVTKL